MVRPRLRTTTTSSAPAWRRTFRPRGRTPQPCRPSQTNLVGRSNTPRPPVPSSSPRSTHRRGGRPAAPGPRVSPPTTRIRDHYRRGVATLRTADAVEYPPEEFGLQRLWRDRGTTQQHGNGIAEPPLELAGDPPRVGEGTAAGLVTDEIEARRARDTQRSAPMRIGRRGARRTRRRSALSPRLCTPFRDRRQPCSRPTLTTPCRRDPSSRPRGERDQATDQRVRPARARRVLRHKQCEHEEPVGRPAGCARRRRGRRHRRPAGRRRAPPRATRVSTRTGSSSARSAYGCRRSRQGRRRRSSAAWSRPRGSIAVRR